LLLQTAQVSGLAAGLSEGLSSWRTRRSLHDPGKTVLDLAVGIALTSINMFGGFAVTRRMLAMFRK